jgi:hypothetical protein
MADTIQVVSGPKAVKDQVILWERDAAHPNGEIYLVGGEEVDGKPKVTEVGETPGVLDKMATGELARVGSKEAAPAATDSSGTAPKK